MSSHSSPGLLLCAATLAVAFVLNATALAAGRPHAPGGHDSPGGHMNGGDVSYAPMGMRPNATTGMRPHANTFNRNRGHIGQFGIQLFSGYANGCGYEYRRWQQTGSRYWRSRYMDCRSG